MFKGKFTDFQTVTVFLIKNGDSYQIKATEIKENMHIQGSSEATHVNSFFLVRVDPNQIN